MSRRTSVAVEPGSRYHPPPAMGDFRRGTRRGTMQADEPEAFKGRDFRQRDFGNRSAGSKPGLKTGQWHGTPRNPRTACEMKTFELPSILGSIAAAGITLGVIVIGSNSNLRTDLRADIRALESRLSAVEQRQARTEGLLEGLRDAITTRHARESREHDEVT